MAGAKDPQGRKWLLTINNPAEKGQNHQQIKDNLMLFPSLAYFCMADEQGQTYHTHIFFMLEHATRISTIKNRFPEAHIDRAEGRAAECRDYVAKSGKWEHDEKADTRIDGTFEEWGELPDEPGQGARTDIATVYEMIADGKSNAEIMRENPNLAAQISRMDKIRQDILEERYRTAFRRLAVIYIFGPTETGKTRGVMEKHGYGNVFRITDYAHPFDRYAQEPVMCFDEFRSSLPIGDMLNYLDGYPLSLPARYANRVACFETAYIISNIDLKAQYPNVQDCELKTWRAFLRRIHKVVEYHADGTTTNHGNATDYVFPPAPQWVQDIDAEQGKIDELPL